MEEYSGSQFDAISGAVRKKRSQPFRRPPPDSQTYDESNVQSSSSPAPHSDDGKGFSDDTIGSHTNLRRKEFNLNQGVVLVSSSGAGEFNDHSASGFTNKRSSEGVLAPTNWKNTSTSKADDYGLQNDGLESDTKVTKVKLKVGGITRTISTSNHASESGSSKSSRAADPLRRGKQGNSEFASSMDKRSILQGIPWKDFSTGSFNISRDDSSSGKSFAKSGSSRKSKRAPKKHLMDADFDDEDDDEIRFVQKLKTQKINLSSLDFEDEPIKKQRKLASVVADVERLGAIRNGKVKPKKEIKSEDTDYDEEDEIYSDGEAAMEGKKKKQKKESVDYLMENKEVTLRTRQRAIQSNVDFPSGLPPAPPKKQKEKLTDIEQQLKKAEAAQRRRLQNEKAARESEAEAIRKILGQDSNRKKREEKIKKHQEALKEEKAATASMLSGSTIRLVMGPTGTIITFPNELGLPKMFEPRPCSYPPPRENCARPCCPNPYKYRDAKTKLPLCSLLCYKAVQQQKMMPETSICSTS